jgi:hypothetical protein
MTSEALLSNIIPFAGSGLLGYAKLQFGGFSVIVGNFSLRLLVSIITLFYLVSLHKLAVL